MKCYIELGNYVSIETSPKIPCSTVGSLMACTIGRISLVKTYGDMFQPNGNPTHL